MYNTELIRYITESAGDLIGKAEKAAPALARVYVDEAEELLTLGAFLLKRKSRDELLIKEAA